MRPAPPAEVNRILAETYPDAQAELDFRDAFELLVATVLSAQSTDRRVNAVTAVLFARYPTVGALAQADLAEWLGNRADSGRLPPKGFPKNNKFG